MANTSDVDILVIGASAAGLRAACRAGRLLPEARILVLDREEDISTGACGLPYYLSGDIEDPLALRKTPYGLLRDPEFFRESKGIEVLSGAEVTGLDKEERIVRWRSAGSGDECITEYGKLVLATGAEPILLPGLPPDSERISTFKTLAQAETLRLSLETGKIGRVGIVGAGFIGCELAEAFGSLWGAEVVLLEAAESILPGLLDPEMALAVEAYLRSEDVEVHTGCPVERVEETESGVTIRAGGRIIKVDHAILALGVRPSTSLAEEAGLALAGSGGILVDEEMRTSAPDIFAAGDCVSVKHRILDRYIQLPLGSLANRQGRIAGSNLAGGHERFGPVVGSAAVKVFDWNVSSTGITENTARKAGLETASAWGTFTDKADYFPGSEDIHLKLVWERGSGRLLGLQGYGKGEVVKRVDVFASLLQRGGVLKEIQDLEFAYAPPYASALDPLYSLACAARGALEEEVDCISPGSSLDGCRVVDVRMADEAAAEPFSEGDPVNIPLCELRRRGPEIPGDKPLIMVCAKGLRSSESLRILRQKGFEGIRYLGGGISMRPKKETK